MNGSARLRLPIVSLALSLACQIVGLGGGLAARELLATSGIQSSAPLLAIPIAHGVTAWAAATLIRLPRVWRAANFLAAPLVLLVVEFEIPAGIAAWAVALAILIYLPTLWTRVPFFPTSRAMDRAILGQLPTDRAFHFADLGCGFGGLLFEIANAAPEARLYGCEVSPLPFIVARARALLYRGRVRIEFKSLWKVDLSGFDFVYAFLAPPPMPALWNKARREMKSRSTLLINSFPVPAAATRTVEVADGRNAALYVYVMNDR